MKIRIGLTKGRIEKQFIDYFRSLSYNVEPLVNKGRKLQVEIDQIEFVFAKGVDVATYVEHGICDLGIVGDDILMEFQPDVFDLLALPFGKCRFAIAGEPNPIKSTKNRVIATTYPNITTEYFRQKGEAIDIIKLDGSVEVAPLLGLADAIVDIVETGSTLKENGLVVQEWMQPITSRCIANRSSLKIKRKLLAPIIDSLRVKEDVV